MILIWPLLFIVPLLSFYQDDYMAWKWLVIVLVGALYYSHYVSKQIIPELSRWVFLVLLYLLLSASFFAVYLASPVTAFPTYIYKQADGLLILPLDMVSRSDCASSALILLILSLVFILPSSSAVTTAVAKRAAACALILNATLTCVLFFLKDDPRGFVGNYSINGCLIALSIPIIVNTVRNWTRLMAALEYPLVVLCIGAAYSCRASNPLAVLVMVLFFTYKEHSKLLGAIIAGAALYAGTRVTPSLLDPNGRLEHWKHMLSYWRHEPWVFKILGSGFGTYRSVAHIDVHTSDWFFFAHSDWFQIFIELGIVGLLLSLITAFKIFRHTTGWVQATMVGFMACMVFNYPLHSPAILPLGLFALWFQIRLPAVPVHDGAPA